MLLFAVASLVMVAAIALAVDVGYLIAERRQVQAAADAGALAAAHAKLLYMSESDMITIGKDYGAENASVSEDDVVVDYPPSSGDFAGNMDYVQVSITKDVQRFFLGAVYDGEWSVTQRAVAVVEPDGVDVALLALNPEDGGIQINANGGSTRIELVGGSGVSNYNIYSRGNGTFISDEYINANDGIDKAWTTVEGAKGTNPAAAEISDPLETELSPPTLPSAPGNSVPTASGTSEACYQMPTWYQPGNNYSYTAIAGVFPANNSTCIHVVGVSGPTFTFPNQGYRFGNNSGIKLDNYHSVLIDRGVWNFTGTNAKLHATGATNGFEMRNGEYSFLNGATLLIDGNSPDNTLGGDFYFQGSGNVGGIDSKGTNNITLNPGTFIFNGGLGFKMQGNANLHFNAGDYEFWFTNGADFQLLNSAHITSDPGAYVKMYFYGSGNNPANLVMSGNVNMNWPSGQYYFDNGSIVATGSAQISGSNVFLYFTNGGRLFSDGGMGFAFTAPTTQIYPGYYPGVFMYSDRSNTATFNWTGATTMVSRGIVYLPSSKLTMGGYSNAKEFHGQLIVNSLETSGNTAMRITYEEYVQTAVPNVYLVN